MNINYLRHFLAVANELHFGRAAKSLHMEQAPLSQSIRRFEQYLGGELFERSARTGVRLTRLGQDLKPSAQRLVAEFDQTMQSARQQAAGKQHPIRLGFVTAAVLEMIPAAIQRVKQAAPDTETVLVEASTTELLDMLDKDALDACVTLPTADCPAGVKIVTMKSDKSMLALSANHPLVHKKDLVLSDVRDESLIFFPKQINPFLHSKLMNYFEAHGLNFKVTQEARLTTTMLALVAAGLGICVVPQSAALLPFPNVVLREIQPLSRDVMWNLMLAWKPKKASTPLMLFIETLLQARHADA